MSAMPHYGQRYFCSLVSMGLLCLILPVLSQDRPVLPQPTARIEFPLFDFGTRSPSDSIKHDFIIENVGATVLLIMEVRTPCGCINAEAKPKRIPPKQKGAVHVVFNTKGRMGPQKKTIYIVTNDPDRGIIKCQIKGRLSVSALTVGPAKKPASVHVQSKADHPQKLCSEKQFFHPRRADSSSIQLDDQQSGSQK